VIECRRVSPSSSEVLRRAATMRYASTDPLSANAKILITEPETVHPTKNRMTPAAATSSCLNGNRLTQERIDSDIRASVLASNRFELETQIPQNLCI
jgi:hypothetical protein